ncbi:RING-type domain-containing protein [Trichostrongylus colubriformis]|uniref:RING-type domain-containing protein n=1 Tax=Trichostrongylus colubriformis TaxID=6319 RepID=A0AAN8IXQ7_TRICO
MSQLRGKCVICTSILTSDDIAALRCGHTFHFPCISEWIKRSDTCPICREWTAQCLMVKHLYFDCADDPNASQVEVPSAVQVESLSMALAQEKNKHAQAAEEVTRLKSLVDKLKVELAAAKKSYENKIQILEAWLNLQKCHKQTQDRLRACESQLDEARKTEQKLKDELKVERESVRALKKEEHELKNKVAILEKELRGVRGTAIIGSTPSNPKPRSLALDQRPSPQNIRYHLRSRCG